MSDNNGIYSAMVGGKPYKTYIKRILGRVYVTYLNMLTGTPTPEGVVLDGDPKKREPNTMIDVWSEQEDYYFKKMNKRQFELGNITEFIREEAPKEKTIEEFSDEELKAIIEKPFKATEAILNKTNSVAVLYRILTLARELEKSEKFVRHIESRLSEVQESLITPMPSTIEEEL